MADVKTRELGKIVKKRLIELEMTQVQLANILGTTPQELCRMLKGKRPGYKYRKQMLKILKINEAVYRLPGDEEQERNDKSHKNRRG